MSCTSKEKGAGSSSDTTRQNKKVNLAIWSNYLPPELISRFEKQSGVKVQVSNYSSNEELLAKLQAGASGYDVVVPSDYMIFVMNKLGLLNELDYAQIPNSKSIDSKFLKKGYDPENKHSIPYDWGTTGIAINRTLYSGTVKGWKDLFTKEDLFGKFTLLDDAREVIGAALKLQGHSLNSKNPDELNQAKALLLKARKNVKAFTSEPLMPLVNGETAVAHIFMSDALQARRKTGGKIDYIIPEEGGTLWVDSLVIPKGAKNLKEAHQLINFLLEPSSNAATVVSVLVAPANREAFALLPKDIQNDPLLFPPASVLAPCEMIQDLGDGLVMWDRIWTEIKAMRE
jgi:spermidine/putrescine transport system substrate-binding protein